MHYQWNERNADGTWVITIYPLPPKAAWDSRTEAQREEDARRLEYEHQRREAEYRAMIPGQIAALMHRIALKENARRTDFLDGLSDHDFIALKFEIASRPSARWLAPL